jgi:hypothetical protein
VTTTLIALFLATNLPVRMHLEPLAAQVPEAKVASRMLVLWQGWPLAYYELQTSAYSVVDGTLYTPGLADSQRVSWLKLIANGLVFVMLLVVLMVSWPVLNRRWEKQTTE